MELDLIIIDLVDVTKDVSNNPWNYALQVWVIQLTLFDNFVKIFISDFTFILSF